jgi:hypothetical protein
VTNSRRHESELRVKVRPGKSAFAAMQILAMCPLVPVDAFRHIAGFGSIGGAYRRLAKLRGAGLAEMAISWPSVPSDCGASPSMVSGWSMT